MAVAVIRGQGIVVVRIEIGAPADLIFITNAVFIGIIGATSGAIQSWLRVLAGAIVIGGGSIVIACRIIGAAAGRCNKQWGDLDRVIWKIYAVK